MNTPQPAAGSRDDRDFDWMEDGTYPLREDLIQAAIDDLTARNETTFAPSERLTGNWQRTAQLKSGGLFTRVTGPIGGYFIATHASRTSGAGKTFVGDFKICEVRPASYWDAVSLLAGTCRHSEGSGIQALASAEAVAALKIDDMPILV